MIRKLMKYIIFGSFGIGILFLVVSAISYRNHYIELSRNELLQKTKEAAFAHSIKTQHSDEEIYLVGDPIDIFQLPIDQLNSLSLEGEDDTFYTKTAIRSEVTYRNNKIFSIQLSPLKNRIGIFYYPNASYDDIRLKVFNIDKNSHKEIYRANFKTWDVIGDLQWLGNDHIFLPMHCGTDCQGLSLFNVLTGKKRNAAVFGPSWQGEKGERYTVFLDWFSNKVFKLSGYIDEMSGEMKDGQAYLIFKMADDNGGSLGEKRFLFTGNSLIQKS